MLQRVSTADRSVTDRTVSGNGQTVSEDWFSEMARTIFPKDAGLFLHCVTGFEERSCYRYASGDREVPVLVLRAVLHSHQGAPFLAALMHGCEAQWWIDMQRDLHNADQFKKLDLR